MEVSKIFQNLPVRKKDYEMRYKTYYSKSIQYLHSICLVERDIKINVYNVKPDGNKAQVLSTIQGSSLKNTIIKLFNIKDVRIILIFRISF